MNFITFKAPSGVLSILFELTEKHNLIFKSITKPEELNVIDEKYRTLVLIFDGLDDQFESIKVKVGGNGKLCYINVASVPKSPYSYNLEISNQVEVKKLFEELIIKAKEGTEAVSSPKILSRLVLIHGLTQSALKYEREHEISEVILKQLSEFYSAKAVSLLKYDDQRNLFMVMQMLSGGLLNKDLADRILNQNEYEECVQCGDPIVNCYTAIPGRPRFFCAPIKTEKETVGLIRLEYETDFIDISVDKVVLRICADILSTAHVQQKTTRALLESEKRANTILNTTVDAIISIDDRGYIDSFNKAAEDLFGFSENEVLGKKVNILMPTPYKEEHDEYINHYHETGERQIIGIGREVTGKRKDGSTFPMYLAVSEFVVNGKKMFTGIIRDISEQRKLEQEVMRISEHERHRIGQDLHDGLGQMLSGIGMLTKRIENRLLTEKHPLSDDLSEIASLIKEADDYSRGLARGLIKIDLDRGGFNAAVEELTRQSKKLFRIDCDFNASTEINIPDHASAEHLYRIIQEAINNAVKHGQATKVQVNIIDLEKYVRIQIIDNGTGFMGNWRSHNGLGVRIMEFRSQLIGGRLDLANTKPSGAILTCILPKQTGFL